MVFPKYQSVIFVHGCFWHSHGCRYSTIPASRRRFWKKKFAENKKRDAQNIDLLKTQGWRVLVIWECRTKERGQRKLDPLAEKVSRWLKSNETYNEIG